jgi:hypothetical protein
MLKLYTGDQNEWPFADRCRIALVIPAFFDIRVDGQCHVDRINQQIASKSSVQGEWFEGAFGNGIIATNARSIDEPGVQDFGCLDGIPGGLFPPYGTKCANASGKKLAEKVWKLSTGKSTVCEKMERYANIHPSIGTTIETVSGLSGDVIYVVAFLRKRAKKQQILEATTQGLAAFGYKTNIISVYPEPLALAVNSWRVDNWKGTEANPLVLQFSRHDDNEVFLLSMVSYIGEYLDLAIGGIRSLHFVSYFESGIEYRPHWLNVPP